MNARGSVFQRKDGRWVAQLPIGSKERPDGSRRTVYASRYAASEEAADAALAALRREYGVFKGERRDETLAALLDRWIGTLAGTLQPASEWRHHEHVRLHLVPHLGHRRVRDLTPDDVRTLTARLRHRLAPRSVNYVKTTLGLALQLAVEEGTLPQNVARQVKRQRVTPAPQYPLSPEEVARVVYASPDLPLGALWVMALYTGARLGELLALRWRDCDLGRGTLTISRTVALAAGGPNPQTGRPTRILAVAERTKRRASARTIPLPPPAVDALLVHKERHALDTAPGALVFGTASGTPRGEQNVHQRDWRTLIAAAKLPETATPHALRHTAASALLRGRMPLPEVAQVLGHASAATTASVYAHVLSRVTISTADVFASAYENGNTGEQTDAISGAATVTALSTHRNRKAKKQPS